MDRIKCTGCGSMFFFDEMEDYVINKKSYCTHCFPKVRKCAICNEIKVMKRTVSDTLGICDTCKREITTFPSCWLMLRFKVFAKDNFTCRYCGRSPLKDIEVRLEADHILPRSKGGEDKLDNLCTTCKECNHGKMDVLLSEYQMQLIRNRRS